MERPRSTAGSSIYTVPSHKRNVSSIKSLSKLQAPSAGSERPQTAHRTAVLALNAKEKENIQLFITNLKLLDLHSLPDWPLISAASLSSHDSKTRMRCSEWSLYQLFRLYDRQTTSDKLQPFFPPLEPLQSVNLRAALHRCLNELKKNGVLGRETILRKTMLDECSGEKFWELCLGFSGLVLRKVTLESREHYGQPIAQRLGSAQALNKKDRDNLTPLVIAHKSALSRVLSQKHNRRQSYIYMFDSMKDKEDELTNRKHLVETQAPVVESAEHAKELDMIEKEISGNWTTDETFKDAVVNGDPAKPGDHILLQSTDEFLRSISQEDRQDTRRDSGVLEEIELQARAQNYRVKEWQALFAKLQIDKRSSTSSRGSRDAKKSVDLHFDLHHDLGMDDAQPEPLKLTMHLEPTPSYVSKYDEILTSMREELRRTQTARREAEARQVPSQIRKPSITLDAVVGAPHFAPSKAASRRSISPTLPLRPGMTRRASSRTRSYQQPKVISQREPIPFKSELFSPLKRTGSLSPASTRSSFLGSPMGEYGTMATDETSSRDRLSKRESQSSLNVLKADCPASLGADVNDSPIEAGKALDEVTRRPSMPIVQSVSFAHRKSLSERTRMSMTLAPVKDGPFKSDSSNHDQEPASQSERSQALAARTRQSMAGINVPFPVRASSSFSHCRPCSVAGPIVPPKQRTIERQRTASSAGASILGLVHSDEQARRNITPRERLFEADIEYSSVFKSRPKIATSPPLTPATDIGEEASLEVADLNT